MRGVLVNLFLLLIVVAASGQSVITLQGMLLQSDGKPRTFTEIELVPVGADKIINDSRLLSASDGRGKFWFNDVPVGRYTLSINFDDKPTDLSPYDTFFYPLAFDREDAQVITVDKTTRLKNLVFRLPPALKAKTVTGRVLLENGNGASEAMIGFWDLRVEGPASGPGSVRTSADGRFKVLGFVGRKYELIAVAFDHIPSTPWDHNQGRMLGVGRTSPFVVSESMDEIVIKVKLPEAGEDFWKKYFEG